MNKDSIIEATLAFVFNQDLSEVLLIKKEKPVQHAGLLNGLGGKLEPGESHLECVIREVQEEAGLDIPQNTWNKIGNMSWSNWSVSIWTAIADIQENDSFPEINVGWHPAVPIPSNVIENLEWLIPLAVDVNKKVLSNETILPIVDIRYE